MVDIDKPKKKAQLIEAKEIMDRALLKHPKDTSLLYFRGIILFYLHLFYEALIDLDAVIDIEDEPTAKQYLARGRCHACLSMFQEAIHDLTKALEIDEELVDVNSFSSLIIISGILQQRKMRLFTGRHCSRLP